MNPHQQIRTQLALALVALGLSQSVTLPADKPPIILPSNSHAFGKSLADWAVAHAQWQFEVPADQSPARDGADCAHGANGQQGPVWFLAGGGGGVTVRNCTAPVGKALFVPVTATFCSLLWGDGSNEEELRACAKSWEDLNTVVVLEVDGVALPGLEAYRLQTQLYDLTWPEDNIFELPGGADSLISDGTFVLLGPLPKGPHTIHRHVEASDGYMSDVTWNLLIE